MIVGAVDIGTNSMRLLITDGTSDVGRWTEVTGLGRGVDQTGILSDRGIEDTVPVLARYGELMDQTGVYRRMAIATSASRDAANREAFFDTAETALGVRPVLVTGEEEARLAFRGAVLGLAVPGPIVVSDIGGGSTEFVTEAGGVSIDIGSVRITERAIPSRPAPPAELEDARNLVADFFSSVRMPELGSLIGVAGTWTSLGALAQALPEYSREKVDGYRMGLSEVETLIDSLSALTVEETASLPALDPNRAPVILGGAIVAEGVMEAVGADWAYVSEHDTLDGLAMELLAIR